MVDRTRFDPAGGDRWIDHDGPERVLYRFVLERYEVWSESGDQKYFDLPMGSTQQTIHEAIAKFRYGLMLGVQIGAEREKANHARKIDALSL